MVGCIVITLKEKTSKLNYEIKPHQFTNLPLQSNFRFFTSIRFFLVKWKIIGAIIFSKPYINYLCKKLCSKKTISIVVSSMVIGYLVRYILIK